MTTSENPPRKFQRLEAIRGFAAVYVFLGHIILARDLPIWLNTIFRFGQESVMVFFILSGFVIGWTTKEFSTIDAWKKYFMKRALRIYSIWIPMFLLLFLIQFIETGKIGIVYYDLIGNILMLQDFSNVKPGVICDPIFNNSPLWSLHYECWFYAIFPFICLFKPNRRVHLVGILAIFSSVLYTIQPNAFLRLFIYLPVWWFGVHAAYTLRLNNSILFSKMTTPLVYIFLSGVPLLIQCGKFVSEGGYLVLGAHPILEPRHIYGSFLIILASFTWRHFNWLWFDGIFGMFKIFAPISFSLYILHYNLVAYATYLKIQNPAVAIIVYSLITITICIFLEKILYPFLKNSLKFSS